MRFKLVEKFVNLKVSPAEKEQYIDEVWDVLQKGYAKVGGLKGVDREDIMHDEYLWKMVIRDGAVSAVSIYRVGPQHDRKAVCASCVPTPKGKSDLYMIMGEDAKMLDDRLVWAEVSEAPEHMYKKVGMPALSSDAAEEIMNSRGKKIISKNPDGEHYTRIIGGEPKEKTIVGYDIRKLR